MATWIKLRVYTLSEEEAATARILGANKLALPTETEEMLVNMDVVQAIYPSELHPHETVLDFNDGGGAQACIEYDELVAALIAADNTVLEINQQ